MSIGSKIPEGAFSLDLPGFSVELSKGVKKAVKEGMSKDEVKELVKADLEEYAVKNPHAAPTVERWKARGAPLNRLPRRLHNQDADDSGNLWKMGLATAVGFLIGRSV